MTRWSSVTSGQSILNQANGGENMLDKDTELEQRFQHCEL
jgi:hypothetical protein